MALRLAAVQWSLAKIAYLPVVRLSAMAFFAGLYVIGPTACFWTVERLEVFNLLTYGGVEMLSYPMHIYGAWLRRLFTWIVPAAWWSTIPRCYLLGKPDPFGLPRVLSFLAPAAGFGVLAVAFSFLAHSACATTRARGHDRRRGPCAPAMPLKASAAWLSHDR